MSVAFYTMLFILQWQKYGLSGSSLGGISLKTFDTDWLARLLTQISLFFIVGFNCARYYWSAMLIDNDKRFSIVRAALPSWAQLAETSLRMLCLVVLYALPLTLKSGYGGPSFAFFLVLLYFFLVVWDFIMMRYAAYDESTKTLKVSVNVWTGVEVISLLLSIFYLVLITSTPPETTLGALQLIGLFAIAFLILGCIDIFKGNYIQI